MNKYLYIQRFILKKENGNFRYSYFFPVTGIFIGTFIIFMIFSIMDSLGKQIDDRLNSFHYKYYLESNELNHNLVKGSSSIAYIEDDFSEEILNIYSISNFNSYLDNKIANYIIEIDTSLTSNDIIIGDLLAYKYNLDTGDSLLLYFPSKTNLVTKYVPREYFKVGGIFNIDLLDYDKKAIITSFDNKFIHIDSFKYYTDEYKDEYRIKENNMLSNLIIDALNFEKIMYYVFGVVVIFISCFMFMNSITQSIKEKESQIYILNILGLNQKILIKIFLYHTLILITVLTLISILFVNMVIYLYYEYGIFSVLFMSLPFNVRYINLYGYEQAILLSLIYIMSIIATYLPFKILKSNLNEV